MKMIGIIIICSLFILTGCGANYEYLLKDTSFKNRNNSGAVVVSVRADTWNLFSNEMPKVYFREKGSKGNYILSPFSRTAASTIGKDGYGFIDFFELPVGEYEIYSWDISINKGLVGWVETPENQLSIPFLVRPGVVTYWGEIILENHKFQSRDKRDRDLAIANRKYDGLIQVPVYYHALHCVSGCKTEVSENGFTVMTPVFIDNIKN